MKKTILTVMAAAILATTGTALAAVPARGENCPVYAADTETTYTCGGYRGGGPRSGWHHGRGGYGGGYCYDSEN